MPVKRTRAKRIRLIIQARLSEKKVRKQTSVSALFLFPGHFSGFLKSASSLEERRRQVFFKNLYLKSNHKVFKRKTEERGNEKKF
jgi:hypothetical protein